MSETQNTKASSKNKKQVSSKANIQEIAVVPKKVTILLEGKNFHHEIATITADPNVSENSIIKPEVLHEDHPAWNKEKLNALNQRNTNLSKFQKKFAGFIKKTDIES